ncbi:hypothetical protein [Amycolatopsis tucumanensis]|uniref:hypothetical protein n=1 Tax=Amycolatopsis tucumanensis TaxID=401106 RepID=UPI003D74DC0D
MLVRVHAAGVNGGLGRAGRMRPGQRLLVRGAAGSAAVQSGRSMGVQSPRWPGEVVDSVFPLARTVPPS